MRFEAIEIEVKPFIQWHSTDKPLGSLVVDQADIPAYIYNVCPWKIVEGELVERSPEEMAVFEAEFEIKTALEDDSTRMPDINKDYFVYDDYEFPMDEVSRLFYQSLDRMTPLPELVEIKKMDGTKYTLGSEFVPGFLNYYYTKLYEVSKHTFIEL